MSAASSAGNSTPEELGPDHAAAPLAPLIDPQRLAICLGDSACRFDLEVLAECSSTNSVLLQKISANATSAASGLVLVAERQTAGRGRRGRQWLSSQQQAGDSLTFSVHWRFPRGTALSGLSLAVGLALAEALADLGAAGVKLKWPNDLLVDLPQGFAKLGGILIELSGSSGSSDTSAVIGIGLNLRAPTSPEIDQRATGLEGLLSDGLPDRHLVLAALLKRLVLTLDAFSAQGFAPLRARWERLNAYANQAVMLLEELGEPVHGRCLGVDDDGALRVETAAGLRRWLAGDVSLRASSR